MLDTGDKDFKAAIINMFKNLKEIPLKEIKEETMTMQHHKKTINKDI